MKTLPEILDYGLWNEGLNAASDYGTRKYGKRKEAALTTATKAIVKELMGCLPESKDGEWPPNTIDVSKPPEEIKEATHKLCQGFERYGYNQALDEVRARLTAFIGREKP